MPMDRTDHLLIKGIIFFAILALVMYFYPFAWPFEGYQTKAQKVRDYELRLKEMSRDYGKHHTLPAPTVWRTGGPGEEVPIPSVHENDRRHTAELIEEYSEKIDRLKELIEKKQDDNRIQFPSWTKIPNSERNPGVYFTRKYFQVRDEVKDATRRSNVDLDDPNIGFKELADGNQLITRTRAEELLRQLYIAKRVVSLCLEARDAEEKDERARGRKSEAYMRIISVAPEQSVATGPFKLYRNPHYRPEEKNPRSKHFRKYFVRKFAKFIQEYPIFIRLQCDANSFMRFLYSVRRKGQFLVIRNLQITSPYLKHSCKNRRELDDWVAHAGDRMSVADIVDHALKGKSVEARRADVRNGNLIWVELSAAGMDFFDPSLGGLHIDPRSKGIRRHQNRNNPRKRPVTPAGH